MAQRYSDGSPVYLNTPAIQTNFSSPSTAFWTRIYAQMADLQRAAGLVPYLQSGEVQWWYFAKSKWTRSGNQFINEGDAGVGMPFYDDYTTGQFLTTFGRSLQVLASDSDPTGFRSGVPFFSELDRPAYGGASHIAALLVSQREV